ncbi:MAG: response regulator [Roseburia sp.]|nr:response regulator [Roseburia sp.]
MYKLLIVDDEPLVREGLRMSISWEDYGFTVVGEASNGEEALSMIAALLPDVVITDMRMGIMDGLNLIHSIKKDYPKTQIIILTAYNEFTYAKAAIDNDVFAYISKPALNEEIISVFCRLRKKMDEASHIKNQLISYQNYRTDELLLQLLLNPKPSKTNIYDFTKCLNGSSVKKDFFIALLEIDVDKQTAYTPHTQHLSIVLSERLNYCLSINENCICKANLSLTDTALLVFTKSYDFQQQVLFLQDISEHFYNTTNTALTIGVSATFRSLTAIHHAYTQAQKAVAAKSRVGAGKIIDYMEISGLSTETPTLSTMEINEMIQNLARGEERLLKLAINKYFDSLGNRIVDIQIIKSTIIELATTTLQQVFSNSYTLQLVFGKNIRPASDIQELSTTEEIRTYTLTFFERILLNVQCMKSLQISMKQYSPIVSDAISYITANYAKDIKIADVASQLHISESRLMHSFKHETGKTFNNFLTEYRIRLAETIMKSGHYKLYEISTLVGYKNPITFRKAFCKIVGSIPSKYKQQGASDELS